MGENGLLTGLIFGIDMGRNCPFSRNTNQHKTSGGWLDRKEYASPQEENNGKREK